jgi:hypothetical protein
MPGETTHARLDPDWLSRLLNYNSIDFFHDHIGWFFTGSCPGYIASFMLQKIISSEN